MVMEQGEGCTRECLWDVLRPSSLDFRSVRRITHLRGRFHMSCGGRCCRVRRVFLRVGWRHTWRRRLARPRSRHIGRREEGLPGLLGMAKGENLLSWTCDGSRLK